MVRDREGMVSGWNEPSVAYYRELEQQQRALAADAASSATREIHLEFAEKYQKLAERLEVEVGLAQCGQPAPGR
jgi:hypothetical protein